MSDGLRWGWAGCVGGVGWCVGGDVCRGFFELWRWGACRRRCVRGRGGGGGRAWCLGFGVDGMEAMRAVFSEPAGLEHFRLFMTECFCNVPGTRRWGDFAPMIGFFWTLEAVFDVGAAYL